MKPSNNTSNALESLGCVDLSIAAEVEFAIDKLASAMADEFQIKRKFLLFRALSLSDVLLKIAQKHRKATNISEGFYEAADLADDVVLKLKRVYDEELGYEDQKKIREIISELRDSIRNAMHRVP